MQIVIDIDARAYNKSLKLAVDDDGGILGMHLINAVATGTPLPKGHGRLIDADALGLEREVDMADDWKTAHEIANRVKYAPTIIESEE